ncbi:diaminopimelate epimerase [Gemmatimonas groenlandica]|uniref:Diaminopimelate epimerase n=1 Tax=Gemmatimonas groenlandica TaxID=2732249 RepID=A0A6M4IMG3_9BACT|nr:diaminopimelate epimerase [Gemmatimonas groenlandica]QJR35088.1 diaminopimelate epimerase [Gemmatimonas groenlandica]
MTAPLSTLRGIPFAKMTGSGNDFVFFDGRDVPLERVTSPEVIQSICNRHNGIGADGIVVLEPARPEADVRIHYFNSDGTPADLCGNATLCSTSMSAMLGLAADSGMTLTTPAGLIASRVGDGLPEIDLQPVSGIRPAMPIDLVVGEERIGFAIAGIPHLVILCADADAVDVEGRGPLLRRHQASGPAGANVNWVSPMVGGQWRYRTFERGVEGETLACGTGAVATAVLLTAWGLVAPSTVAMRTSSGRDLEVRLTATESGFRPTLRGEGRVVFRGVIDSI